MTEATNTVSAAARNGHAAEPRFAVLLNVNAKKVSEAIREMVAEIVAPEDVYYSRSKEESDEICRKIIEKGYHTVFAGGGDGTVIDFMDRISRFPAEKRPMVGILMLGTGNAMARMVSSGYVTEDLRSYSMNASKDGIQLALIETEGRRFTFGGLGMDAEGLNDYRELKKKYDAGFMKQLVQSLPGYLFSIFCKTVPRVIKRKVLRTEPRVKVTALDDNCSRIGADGKETRRYSAGQILYEGKALLAIAGTVPYFGYGFKIMPYASLSPGRFHLRIGHVGLFHGLWILPKLWKGTYHGKATNDFFASAVRIEYDQPMPLEIAGDAEGLRKSVEFRVVPDAVRLVHLF